MSILTLYNVHRFRDKRVSRIWQSIHLLESRKAAYMLNTNGRTRNLYLWLEQDSLQNKLQFIRKP